MQFLPSPGKPPRGSNVISFVISQAPELPAFISQGSAHGPLYWPYDTAVFQACPLCTPLPPSPSPEIDCEGPCHPQSEGPCRPHLYSAQGLPCNGWNGRAHVHTVQAARGCPQRQHPGAGGQEDQQRASMVPISGTQRGLRPAAHGEFPGSFAINTNLT